MENSIFGVEATGASLLATSKKLFNDLGKRYETACGHNEGQARSLQWLIANLPSQSKIYDVGCGTGRPATGILTDAGMDVTGLDISPVMLKVAAEQVPNAKFVEADLRTWEPPSDSGPVDCVVAYFSLICDVTQDDIRGFFIRVYRWLKPGGLFVFGTVPLAGNMVPFKWLGRDSVGSGLDIHDNLNSINVAGFRIEKHEVTAFEPKAVEAGLCSKEEAWPEEHLFVYARRP